MHGELPLKETENLGAIFSEPEDLLDANLGGTRGKAIFENVTFEEETDILRTSFLSDAIFIQDRFRGV